MLPLAKVQEIKRLLDEGRLSQRKIAKRLGVSRGVVAAIANGRRGLHGRESSPGNEEPELSPPERCPSCGHLVHMPCVFCRAIAYAERQKSDQQRQAAGAHNLTDPRNPPPD